MSLYPQDKPAAFMGLVGGVVFITAVVFGLVQWTNARFASHHAEAAPAAPAAGAPATTPAGGGH